jgi:hypothetical protein
MSEPVVCIAIWYCIVLKHSPVVMSHNLIVVSADPLANILGVICFRPTTPFVCPVRLNLHVFVVRFQIRTV